MLPTYEILLIIHPASGCLQLFIALSKSTLALTVVSSNEEKSKPLGSLGVLGELSLHASVWRPALTTEGLQISCYSGNL